MSEHISSSMALHHEQPASSGAHRLQLPDDRDALLGEVERVAHLGGFVWRRGEDTLHWSHEMYRMLGYDPSVVTPSEEAFFAAVHPDDRERVRASWAAACEGALGGAEYRIVHQRTDEVRYVRGSGQPYLQAGQVLHIVGTVQDITEAKRDALALEEARAMARSAERTAGVGSFVLRTEPPVEALWADGLRGPGGLDALATTGAGEAEQLHVEDREKHARWWDRLIREHASEPLTVRVVRPDGSLRHLQTQAALVRLANGEERLVGTTLDVTERVELEEQLRQAAKMEAIGTLAAGVAHDFNNYLMVLDQSLSMLSDSEEQDRDDLVASARLALGRSRDLTRQLLAFARRQAFTPEFLDLAEVVRDFYDLLGRAIGQRATLSIERSGASCACRLDPRHAERMLTNLVVNAADAIEETRRGAPGSGRIIVRIEGVTLPVAQRAVPEDVPAGAYACVSVEDNGGGVEAKRQPRIFEPYFTTKPEGRGTGLGLASVYGMARQNNGLVTVSEVPEGARFTLWFPHAERSGSTPRRARAAASATPPSALDHRILIVENDPLVRDAAQRILNAAGFRTLAASQGQEALDLLGSGFDVRLIVSDLEMPVMSDREFAERLGGLAAAPPVIFMTGYSEEGAGGSSELGQMLLAKPFTPERLVEFVKRALKIIDSRS
jgi:two-component system cell cycle sensor histidine kinase/response regulator CckA